MLLIYKNEFVSSFYRGHFSLPMYHKGMWFGEIKTSSRYRNQAYIKKDLLWSLWLMIKNYDLQCLKTLLSVSTLNLYKNLCYLHNLLFLMLLVVLCEAYLAPEGREDEKRLFLKEKRIIIWLLLSDHSSSPKKRNVFADNAFIVVLFKRKTL